MNNKGFVATSVLYCLAAILAVVVLATLTNVRTIRDYVRISSNDIKEDLNGNIYPEIKMGTAVRIVDNNGNPYIEGHVIVDSGVFDSKVRVLSDYNYNTNGEPNKQCGLSVNFKTNCSVMSRVNANSTLDNLKSSLINYGISNANFLTFNELQGIGYSVSGNYFTFNDFIHYTTFYLNDRFIDRIPSEDISSRGNYYIGTECLSGGESCTDGGVGLRPVFDVSKNNIKLIVE